MCIAGNPIDYEELTTLDTDEAIERIKREVELLRLGIRGKIRKASNGRLTAPGPGDVPYWELEDSNAEAEKESEFG